jgi:hypothetical protein
MKKTKKYDTMRLLSVMVLVLFLFACASGETEAKVEVKNDQAKKEDNSVAKADTYTTAAIEDEVITEAKPEESINQSNHQFTKSVSNTIDEQDVSGQKEGKKVEAKDEQTNILKAGNIIKDKSVEENSTQEESSTNLHGIFNELLESYVSSSGKVNYAGLKSNQTKLEKYLKALSSNTIKKDWSRNKKLAYWINAYNAFTIKRILDHYPLKSIMDLDNGNTWDVKWIKLGSETYSLNQIEHEIIRPQFKDARIHFAVNCAAKSCPPLLNKAYTEENVNRYLEKRTVQFINDINYNTIEKRRVQVSKIFDWYKEDFGDLIDYLNQYSKKEEISKKAKVSFKAYDWSLNN